ncbi:MAG: DUF389 domain-containing protein [Pseudanabaenaceae cyanobacterium bins.39]|nr:DUF389 domain-containing protein [Pseudanabaenaceae cyanobacterium bins.39]
MNRDLDNPQGYWQNIREWLATQMGVDTQRKVEVYLEISQSATLKDATYWLQIIFAAGIATLGLVLSSPAVIIGAMLISPLMGPILSLGLSLAAGDFILLARAIANLALSCAVAISFAILLIFTLPFKEATAEILARTTPNTLDLGVALFSGAIGTIATCRPVKGVITSIPGVAIAVALMPPLCVVGFGLGIAFSLSFEDGLQIARGGGLLFLTNLVAISFSSLIIFLALHIDTDIVRERVKQWESNDQESLAVQNFLGRYVFLKRLRPIGSLPVRLFMGLLAILALLVPLSNSFIRLSEEISQKQQQNALRRAATNLWKSKFSNEANNQPRSSIERLVITEQDQFVSVKLNVFTSRLYSKTEQDLYVQELAQKLSKRPQQIQFTLTEIPTASNELIAKKEEVSLPVELKEPTISELQADLQQNLSNVVADLTLPPNAQLVDYAMIMGKSQGATLAITYLSDRPISDDAKILVMRDLQKRLGILDARVNLEQIAKDFGSISFAEDSSAITDADRTKLDKLGQLLQQYPNLRLSITVHLRSLEANNLRQERYQVITRYLSTSWQISSNRVNMLISNQAPRPDSAPENNGKADLQVVLLSTSAVNPSGNLFSRS